MRLLNTRTLEFEFFMAEKERPQYAILSHTWGREEVTYLDMTERREKAERMEGYRKIKFCTEQAQADSLDYCWVDTCCIDKNSSSELSEAINSMYQWYKNAERCYAYLGDVDFDFEHHSPDSAFRKSKWFTRGWTLQELIAPRDLRFYGAHQKILGTKELMKLTIEEITGVSMDYLSGTDVRRASIATRMSWAAGRTTTRPEDSAYCLMGLFDVNMPMLYGEGNKAFIRLQEEILRKSTDHSLFAWSMPKGSIGAERKSTSGFLASTPECFASSGLFEPIQVKDNVEPYTMTNGGLRITVQFSTNFILLDCVSARGRRLKIPVLQLYGNQYVRDLTKNLEEMSIVQHRGEMYKGIEIYVTQEALQGPVDQAMKARIHAVYFSLKGSKFRMRSCTPPGSFFEEEESLLRLTVGDNKTESRELDDIARKLASCILSDDISKLSLSVGRGDGGEIGVCVYEMHGDSIVKVDQEKADTFTRCKIVHTAQGPNKSRISFQARKVDQGEFSYIFYDVTGT